MAPLPELEALKRNVEQLPRLVTLQLRSVAFRKAREVRVRAQQILKSKIRGHSGRARRSEDSYVVIEQAERKQFLVSYENPEMPNLGLWLERGTSKMSARPHLRPAADEIEPSYIREMVDAAQDVMAKALGAER